MGESADTSDCTGVARPWLAWTGRWPLWRSLVCLSGIGNRPAANEIVATNVVRSESKHTQKQVFVALLAMLTLKKKLRDVITYIVD